jgi:hypothetical protein
MVLDLTRLSDKLIIDRENMLAIVSPGIITANIHKKAEEVGLFYPPDPSSSNVATIGGNFLENEKMKDQIETHVATVITVNPGYQMQMSIGIQREGAAKRIKSMHLVEILAEACGIH